MRFPLGKEHLKQEEITESDVVYKEEGDEREYDEKAIIKTEEGIGLPEKGSLPSLLIVEEIT